MFLLSFSFYEHSSLDGFREHLFIWIGGVRTILGTSQPFWKQIIFSLFLLIGINREFSRILYWVKVSQNRSSLRRCSVKKDVKISQISQENTCVGVFFNKVAGLRGCNLFKKRLQRMFSCEYCENFKNICFEEHQRTTASERSVFRRSFLTWDFWQFWKYETSNFEWCQQYW